MLKYIVEWTDPENANEIRHTEMEVPEVKTWTELQEIIRQFIRKAYKYSGTKYPEGINKEGELK